MSGRGKTRKVGGKEKGEWTTALRSLPRVSGKKLK